MDSWDKGWHDANESLRDLLVEKYRSNARIKLDDVLADIRENDK